MKNLADSFQSRKAWFNTRSSTIFPFFDPYTTDHYIVFQNYWSWKSSIPASSIRILVSFYSSSGKCAYNQLFNIAEHNCISLNPLFNNIGLEHGERIASVHFEVLSLENIGFPFPAVLLVCHSKVNGEISAVHSGGRILNQNEPRSLKEYTETNWFTRLDSSFTPFFHVFNDSYHNDDASFVKVSVFQSGSHQSIFSGVIPHDPRPFCSRVYYLRGILDHQTVSQLSSSDFWVEVTIQSTCFPRLIVGNYDMSSQFHYLTHSFGKIDSPDYVTTDVPGETVSTLSCMTCEPLVLNAKSFPTNSPCDMHGSGFLYGPNSSRGQATDHLAMQTRGSSIFTHSFYGTSMTMYQIVDKAPSRVNVSYNYRLPNSRHPTDIATGFKSIQYPPKRSHWGHGIALPGFSTAILIRSYNPRISDVNQLTTVVVEFFAADVRFERTLTIPAVGWNYLCIPSSLFADHPLAFSWRFVDEQNLSLEVMWVSFNETTGAVCGDHSF